MKTTLNQSELLSELARANPHLTRRDLEKIVAVILEEIAAALEDQARVELRGFGVFAVKWRRARAARNPRTGESLQTRGSFVPFFKSGKVLREALNP